MGQIGELLKQAREKKGLTLRDAEEATKIRLKYLEALEEENYKVIPGRVYTKGFLRNYAAYLELDGNQLLDIYNEIYQDPEDIVKQAPESYYSPPPKAGNRKSRYIIYLLIGIVLLILLLAKVFLEANPEQPIQPNEIPKTSNEEQAVPQPNQPQEPEPAPPAQPEPVPPTQPDSVQVSGVNLVLAATGGQSWYRVVVDNTFRFEGTLTAGTNRTFEGKEKITLRLGNAPAIAVTLNGQLLGNIGGGKQVVNQEFTAPGP